MKLSFLRFLALFTVFAFNIECVKAASPLGYKIGEATFSEIKKNLGGKIPLEEKGVNPYSGGPIFVSNECDPLEIEGLKRLTVIFDQNDKLSAVILTMENENGQNKAELRERFYSVYDVLKEKYAVLNETLPVSGHLRVNLKSPENAFIQISAKKGQDVFNLRYLSNNFVESYVQKKTNASGTKLTKAETPVSDARKTALKMF